MALNIVTAIQPLSVDNIITFIYGDPGIWKTSLAFTADKPILLDFDKGAYRAGEFRKDTVKVDKWSEVVRLNPAELVNYNTIVVDTAGRALDMITEMLRGDSRNTRKDGALTMQGYGKLGLIFADWLKMLRTLGKDIVILAHASEDKDGDDVIKRPDMVGGSKKESYKVADMMGYMTTQHGQNGAVRMLNFVPHPAYLAKDSGNIGNIVIQPLKQSPNQLADIIQATKDHINSLSIEAAKAQKELDDLRAELIGIDNAEHINTLIDFLKPDHPLYKQMKIDIWTAAKGVDGIEFDNELKRFVDTPAVIEDEVVEPDTVEASEVVEAESEVTDEG